jgi:hypothetical protein
VVRDFDEGRSTAHRCWRVQDGLPTTINTAALFSSPDFEAAGRDANLIVTTITMAAEKRRVRVAPEAQAIFFRLRHQPRRPPLARTAVRIRRRRRQLDEPIELSPQPPAPVIPLPHPNRLRWLARHDLANAAIVASRVCS